jgi:nucleoid-associated protein YgaU
LIVGFSLILLVGVLISDHLSSARKAAIAKVEPEPVPVAPIPMTLAAAPERSPTSPSPIIEVPPTNPPQTTPGTQPPADDNQGPVARSEMLDRWAAEPRPVAPASTVSSITLANGTNADEALLREVDRLGGRLTRNADGTTTIVFPPNTQTVPEHIREVANRPAAPQAINTPVGQIENLKTHSVASGESLYQIAAKYYGNGNMWKELAKFNGMDKSGAVRAGMKIKVPSKEALGGRTLVTTPPSSYTVKRGDTLGDISMKTLGTSKRWQEIVDLNNLDDEDALTPGDVLKIPAKKS